MPTTGRFSCWFDLPERNAIVIHLAAENFDLGKAYRKQQSRKFLGYYFGTVMRLQIGGKYHSNTEIHIPEIEVAADSV